MRIIVRKLGLFILLAGTVIWLLGGARRGVYVTTEDIPIFDPIAEIEGIHTHPKFLPGIETLALAYIFGGSFFLGSFLFTKKL